VTARAKTTAAVAPDAATQEPEYVKEGEGDEQMAGGGWSKLRDEKKGPAGARGSGEELAIEMEDAASRTITAGTAGAVDGAGYASDGGTSLRATRPVEYKVYKRRWFGLVQLTLLNIIASIDVSFILFSCPVWLCHE